MRRKWSDAQKKKIVGDWKESGLNRVEFCQKIGIAVSRLDAWRRKYDSPNPQSRKPENNAPLEFVEIANSTQAEGFITRKFLRIVSSYGAVIEVPL